MGLLNADVIHIMITFSFAFSPSFARRLSSATFSLAAPASPHASCALARRRRSFTRLARAYGDGEERASFRSRTTREGLIRRTETVR